jgi:copper(I)-binding protein
MPTTPLRSCVLVCGFLALLSTPVHAEVKATNAWVRATVAAQKSTGAFLTLTSSVDAKVLSASSPAAAIVEIHSSSMEGGMMQMRAVDALPLPAGKPVELKPGGLHVMLMGLAKAVVQGEKVPIVFVIEDAAGKRSTLEVRAEARPLGSR